MAGQPTPKKHPPSPNGAPTLTPLGHYAGRPDIAISRQVTVVGSKPGSRLHLASSTVSQSHALIVNCAGGAYIRDLASRTRVYINGKEQREADLNDSDLLQIGKFKFQYNAGLPGVGLEPGQDGHEPAPEALLKVEGGELPLPIEARSVLIGRRPTCDVPLIEDSVSTAHAILFEMNGRRYIRDLSSRTGTFVNGQRAEPQAELKLGDQIRIGETTIEYVSASGDAAVHSDEDELDHLVSTAPLGTAGLDADAEALEDEPRHAADEALVPMEDESEQAAPIAPAARIDDEIADRVQLEADSVEAGPDDTAVLRAERAAAARKPPTLKAPADEADDALVDDVLGLTPESRQRETAKVDELSNSRRGWRGMQADEGAPLADDHAPEEIPHAEPEPLPAAEAPPLTSQPAEDARDSTEEPQAEVEPAIEPVLPTAQAAPASHVMTGDEVEPPVETLPADTFDIQIEEPSPLASDEPHEPQGAEQLHLPAVVDETAEEIEPLPLTPEEGAPLDLSVDETPAAVEEVPPVLELTAPEPEPRPEISAEAGAEATPASIEPPLAPVIDEAEVSESPARAEQAAAAPQPAAEAEPGAAQADQPATAPAPEPEQKGKRKRGGRAAAKPRASRKKKGAAADVVAEATPLESPAPAAAAELTASQAVEPAATAPVPAEEPLPPSTSDEIGQVRDRIEVVESTDPTPESALDEQAVADMLAEPLAGEEQGHETSDLTDTSFGRAVDSFVGDSTGPLVESPEAAEPIAEKAEAPEAPGAHEGPTQAVQTVREDESLPTSVTAAEAPAKDDAAALDDMLADVTGEASPEAHDDEVAAIDAEIEQLDLAIEEANEDVQLAKAAPEAAAGDEDALAFEDGVSSGPPPALAELPEQDLELEPLEEFEAVDEAPAPIEPEAQPEPVAREEAPPAPPVPPSAPAPATPPAPPRAASPAVLGANQEHFLGGMPLKLNKPVKPAGARGAGAAAARQGMPAMPPPPPRATRPNARTRSPWDIIGSEGPVQDLGASIPPFAGKSAKKSQITTGFDGLAMPPVRETDVFSQMQPAAFVAGLAPQADDEDIFSRGARVARQQQESPHGASAEPPRDSARTKQSVPVGEPAAPNTSQATDASAPPTDLASAADAVWADEPPAPPEGGEELPIGAGVGPTGHHNRPLSTPPTFAPAESQPAPAKRKRRWFGLRSLLITMLLLAAAAAGGVYGFVKKQTTVVGKLRFDNFPSRTIERQALLAEQKKLVGDHAFREQARKLLAQRHPDLPAGFLADPVAYDRAAQQADWAPDGSTAFAFTYNGRDVQGDPHRVRAVMLALYEANTGKLEGAGAVQQTVRSLTAAHEEAERRVADLKSQIDRLGAAALKMPQPEQIQTLTAEVERLEKENTAAARRALEIKVDVERMQAAMPAQPQPAGTAQAPVVDPQLTKLQAELKALNEKLAAGKAARAEAAEAAQVALDAALQSFQKQVADAQAVAKGNPELSAYLAAAEELQAGTRDLTQKLIRRQQEQQRRLAELKTRLAEKAQARRADAWKRDPELTKLGDELAIAQRQVSAAENGGAPKAEVAELKSHVSLLEEMIKARQTLVGDDQFYADAINQLEKLIEDQQRGIDADRKHTEAELEKMQAAFARSQPAVEKMPQAQRELATSLARQLEEINAARRKYNLAADAVAGAASEGGEGDSVNAPDEVEAAAAQLAGQIDARRKELAAQAKKAATAEQEQNRLAALKSREAELAAAQTAAAETQQALDAAHKALRTAKVTESEAREAGERRDALLKERELAEKDLAAVLRQLELKRSQASSSPEPIAPAESDVEMTVTDPRPTYALASVGGIVAVFTLLTLLTGTGAAAQPDEIEPEPPLAEPAPLTASPVLRTPPTPMPAQNGNGAATAAQSIDSSQPRVMV